jgi:hypothetical protein
LLRYFYRAPELLVLAVFSEFFTTYHKKSRQLKPAVLPFVYFPSLQLLSRNDSVIQLAGGSQPSSLP